MAGVAAGKESNSQISVMGATRESTVTPSNIMKMLKWKRNERTKNIHAQWKVESNFIASSLNIHKPHHKRKLLIQGVLEQTSQKNRGKKGKELLVGRHLNSQILQSTLIL